MKNKLKKSLLAIAITTASFNGYCVEGGSPLNNSYSDGVFFDCSGTMISGDWVLTTSHCFRKDPYHRPSPRGLGYLDGVVFSNGQRIKVVPNSAINSPDPYLDTLDLGNKVKLGEGSVQFGIFKLEKTAMYNTIHFIEKSGIQEAHQMYTQLRPLYMIGYGGQHNKKGFPARMQKTLTFHNNGSFFAESFMDAYLSPAYDENYPVKPLENDPYLDFDIHSMMLKLKTDEYEGHKGWNVGGDSGDPFLNQNARIVGVDYGIQHIADIGVDMRHEYIIGDDFGRNLGNPETDLFLNQINGWHYPTYISTANDEGQLYPAIKDEALEKNNELRTQVQAIIDKAPKQDYCDDATIKAMRPLQEQIINNADDGAMPNHIVEKKVEKDASDQSVFTVTIQSLHKDNIKPNISTEGDVQIVESTNADDCNNVSSIKPYNLCTIKVTSNGGQGKIILSDKGEEILINPDMPKVPSDEDKTNADAVEGIGRTYAVENDGGSMGVISGLMLACVAVTRRLLSKEKK